MKQGEELRFEADMSGAIVSAGSTCPLRVTGGSSIPLDWFWGCWFVVAMSCVELAPMSVRHYPLLGT